MLGIGLGGFSKGVSTGLDIGERVQEGREKRKKSEMFEGAATQGASDYEAAVQSGEATAGDPSGPMRYAMPRIVQPLFASGDVEGAQTAMEWVKSDQAKQGSTMFASGLLKANRGDIGGALKDFVGAARVKGYAGGVEVGDVTPTEGGAYSVTFKDKDGNERSQVFKSGAEVADFGARYLNPESAFDRYLASESAKSEDAREVAKAGDKKRAELGAKTEDDVVRTNLGLGAKTPNFIGARNLAIRELNSTGQLGSFSGTGTAEQEALIERKTQEILSRHDGSVPGLGDASGEGEDELIVDPRTGELVSAAN
jgi:hypothetical protein